MELAEREEIYRIDTIIPPTKINIKVIAAHLDSSLPTMRAQAEAAHKRVRAMARGLFRRRKEARAVKRARKAIFTIR